MKIGEFRQHLKLVLDGVVTTGEPEVISRQQRPGVALVKPYVEIAPSGLIDDLVEAAGDAGQDVLKRYRAAPEQRKQEEAA